MEESEDDVLGCRLLCEGMYAHLCVCDRVGQSMPVSHSEIERAGRASDAHEGEESVEGYGVCVLHAVTQPWQLDTFGTRVAVTLHH